MNKWDKINEKGEIIKKNESFNAASSSGMSSVSSTRPSTTGNNVTIYVWFILIFIVIIIVWATQGNESKKVDSPIVNNSPTPYVKPQPSNDLLHTRVNAIITFNDGSKYEGSVINGLMDGQGTIFFAQNNELNWLKFEGLFEGGEKKRERCFVSWG